MAEKKPNIRFKGFEEEWEDKTLGSMGETFSGLSGKSKKDFGHGDAQYITYMNVFSNPIASPDGALDLDGALFAVKRILVGVAVARDPCHFPGLRDRRLGGDVHFIELGIGIERGGHYG